jgi:uncharacterized membrane protein
MKKKLCKNNYGLKIILLLPCHEKWSLYLLENGIPDTHPWSTLAVIIKNIITVNIYLNLAFKDQAEFIINYLNAWL